MQRVCFNTDIPVTEAAGILVSVTILPTWVAPKSCSLPYAGKRHFVSVPTAQDWEGGKNFKRRNFFYSSALHP